MDALLSEVNAPTANYRGRFLLVMSWIEQCLRSITSKPEAFDSLVRRSHKKGLIDDELSLALATLDSIRERAAHRELGHHELLSGPHGSELVRVVENLRVGYDELERLDNEHQLVFQFALAVLLHLTGPADHPDSAVFPVRLIWRP